MSELRPVGEKMFESDEEPEQVIELSSEFFSKTGDTCPQLKENPYKQRKLIKIANQKITHNEIKCMKAAAIDGLTVGNSSITSLIDNYRFSNKKGQELQLDLRQSLFEGTPEQQLAVFKDKRQEQIKKQKAAIIEKFPNMSNAIQRNALLSIVKTLDGFLEANEERIVSKAIYLNEYADFLLTVLLLGFHNTDVKIKDLEDRIDYLMAMDPNKADLKKVAKQQKEQQAFRESCCDKIVELERKLNEMEKKSKNISDSKPSVSQPVVESNANDNKITILFQLINELSKNVAALDSKKSTTLKEKFDKLKCLFSRPSTSKTREEEEAACNEQTRKTLEDMDIDSFVIGGRKKKTRRKKLGKNKISLKRKHLKFKKIKGGKRFKITKKKRNKRSRKIYYKKH